MLKSYLLVALRSLRKQKVFSVINLLGMAVGMAGFTLFALMAGSKLNADRFHEKAASIYCLVQVRTDENREEEHTTFLPGPLAPALLREFPEIEGAARILPAGRVTFRRGDDAFFERAVLFADPDFLTIFSFGLKDGDPDTVLASPDSLVLSERAAAKYFGDEDPIGQVLTMGASRNLTVTGVARDVPRTSSLYFDFLLSMETARSLSSGLDDWDSSRHTAFLLAGNGFEPKAFEAKLPAFVERNYGDSQDSPQQLYVMLFREFRLNSRHISSLLSSSHPASVYATFAIGVLLLFVVSINFINLSTARYMHRIREIGMRKVIGATRRQLILQFQGESLLLALLALPLAILFYELMHPAFYAYMGDFSVVAQTSAVSNSIWNYPFLLKYLVAAALITGLFSGMYPAFVLSSYKPLSILSGRFTGGKKKKRGSKALIVFQFSLAIIFIAAASIIQHQSKHFIRADLGYSRDRVAMIGLTPETRPKLELLKTKVQGHSSVVRVTASTGLPVIWENLRPARLPDAPEDEAVSMHAYGVDYGFPEALDIRIRQGRSFSRKEADADSFIINAAAARKMEWDDPVGRQLTLGEKTGTVIGMAEDFLFADIGFDIPPAVLFLEPDNLNYLLIKYSDSADFTELKAFLKSQWLSLNPDLPFECRTLDDIFGQFFRLLSKITGFLRGIGITTVLFSCLGLLGLASYMVEQRTREIGIRKILGASSPRILWRLMREYVVLVAVANVLALGLLYFGWHKVLQTGLLFVTDISAATYASALLFSLGAAALAVTSQTWKAVRANPANSLRHE